MCKLIMCSGNRRGEKDTNVNKCQNAAIMDIELTMVGETLIKGLFSASFSLSPAAAVSGKAPMKPP